ncbi:hypothetical protein KSW81_000471 [Nannochloris sp. 'desiccata']|nr:hypothetical protein KSW81_000471 [Chlorella desiccata (nom. nud.)]
MSASTSSNQVQVQTTVYTVSPAVKAVAGSLGGIVEAVMLQPVDVVKTRLQLDKAGQYKGMFHAGKTIAAEEGAGALWKGLTPFKCYVVKMEKLTSSARLTAGLGAGVSEALLIVTPFEVVKTRLQQQRGVDKALLKYRGPVHTALTVVKEEGLRAMWSGGTATTIRQGSNQMSLFWGKAVMDGVIWDKHDGDGKFLTPAQSAASGFVAACIGPLLNNPFDVVKTRMQAARNSGQQQYKGFAGLFSDDCTNRRCFGAVERAGASIG